MRLIYLLSILFAALIQPVHAQAPGYAGLVERLAGQIKAKSTAGAHFQPAAFSRLRAGDEITLAADAEMQIIYFDTRKREQWRGPAVFRVTATGSETVSGQAVAASELKGVPSRVPLAAAGNVQRIGGLTLRGGPTKFPDDAAVERAQTDYAEWVAAADPGDILPELYMIGFLQERRDPRLLQPYVEAMLRKQPGRPELRSMADRLGISAPSSH